MKNLSRLFAVAALVAVMLFASGNVASAQGRTPRFPNGGAFRQGFVQGRGFARGANGFGVNRFGGFGRPVVVNRFGGFGGFAPLGFRRPLVVAPQFVPVPVGVNGFGVNGFGVNAFGVSPFGFNGFNQFGGVGGFAAPGCF